jgi:hypothetical protein
MSITLFELKNPAGSYEECARYCGSSRKKNEIEGILNKINLLAIYHT